MYALNCYLFASFTILCLLFFPVTNDNEPFQLIYHRIKQSQAKFSMERAQEALDWVEAVLRRRLNYPSPEGLRDQLDFAHALKDGIILCE